MQLSPRLPNESAHDFALRILKHNIVNLYFLPGSFVSCHELAGKIGVSRTPLREAMQELERIALLKVHANAGSQISQINYQQLNELRFVRQTMDAAAVEMVCDRITPDDYFPLEEMLRTQHNCLKTGRSYLLMDLDDIFHRHLYSLAGMDTTYKIIEPFRCHFERFRRLNYNALEDVRLVSEHSELVESLKRRDRRMAKKIAGSHFSASRKDDQALLDQHPGYFIDDGYRPDSDKPASGAYRQSRYETAPGGARVLTVSSLYEKTAESHRLPGVDITLRRPPNGCAELSTEKASVRPLGGCDSPSL